MLISIKLIKLVCLAIVIMMIAIVALSVLLARLWKLFIGFRQISMSNDAVFVEGFKQHMAAINQNKEAMDSDINSLYESVKNLETVTKRTEHQASSMNDKITAIIMAMK